MMEDSNPSGKRSSVPSLLSLPPEILLRIFECSPPSSLKQLRASSKNLKALADPLLWHSIYLYPHMDHFRQILDLSMQPLVQCHVHQIVYDLQWAPIIPRIIKRIQSVHTARATAEQKSAALCEAQRVKKGTLEPSRDDDIELLFLQDILRNLKSLESIIVLENNRSPTESNSIDISSIPSYYQKIRERTCGSVPDTDLEPGIYCFPSQTATRSTKRIIVATHSLGKRIRNFEIYNAYWDHVTAFEPDGKHLHLLSDFIDGLKTLTLKASFASDLPPHFLLRNLGLVLNLASNLESANLSFSVTMECDPLDDDDWNSDDGGAPTSRQVSVIEIMESGIGDRPSRWGTGLRRLALSELRCSSSDLKRVIGRAAPTLKELEINHLELIPESADRNEDPVNMKKPCLVKLLGDIRSMVRLDTILLTRRFWNYGAQQWSLSSEKDLYFPPTLQEEVFLWMLGAEHCPLEGQAIPEGANDVTDDQLEAARKLSDYSFYIVPYRPRADHDSANDSEISPNGFLPDIDVSSPIPYSPVDSYDGLPTSPIYNNRSPTPDIEALIGFSEQMNELTGRD